MCGTGTLHHFHDLLHDSRRPSAPCQLSPDSSTSSNVSFTTCWTGQSTISSLGNVHDHLTKSPARPAAQAGVLAASPCPLAHSAPGSTSEGPTALQGSPPWYTRRRAARGSRPSAPQRSGDPDPGPEARTPHVLRLHALFRDSFLTARYGLIVLLSALVQMLQWNNVHHLHDLFPKQRDELVHNAVRNAFLWQHV